MAQITFIISGGTPDYTVTIEGYMGSPSEWVFNSPGQYTIQVDYQEAYRLLIVDSRGCTASDDYGYTRPDSLINFYIISRVNFNDGTNIYIKNMTPQDACDALLAKCEDNLVNGDQGGTGQIANNPPLIGDTVYAYWYTDSLIKFNDGTFIFTTEWNGSRCGVDKYIGHIEDGVITEMILCTLPATTTTTTVEPTTTTTTTTCDPSKCDYGLLYNWYAVGTEKLAPTGWHVPTDDEWTTLSTYLGGEEVAGGKMKTTGLCDWAIPNTDATNESGFSALPFGWRELWEGAFTQISYYSTWWSSSVIAETWSSSWYTSYDNASLFWDYYDSGHGWGVRCLMDSPEDWYEGLKMTDIDGNDYDTVKIGNQVWTVQNLKVTHYNDGEAIPNVEDDAIWMTLTTGALCAYNNDWNTYACVPEPTTTTTTTEEPTTTTTTEEPTTTTTTEEPTTTTTTEEPTTTTTSTTVESTTTTTTTTVETYDYCVEYGYLYNWYAATDARNIAASGWHLPIGIYYDINDTYTLANFLEPGCNWSTNTVGNLIKESGTEFWEVDSGSTNSTGFNARGAGVRSEVTGAFTSKNVYMEFWTESQYWNSGSTAPVCILSSMYSWFSVQKSGTNVEDKKRGISIRLIKDSTTLSHGQSGTYTGNDGKVYRTICIGTQEWLADNLAETKYRNGETIPTVTDNTTWAGLTTGAKCAYDNTESYVGYEGVCSTTTTTTTSP